MISKILVVMMIFSTISTSLDFSYADSYVYKSKENTKKVQKFDKQKKDLLDKKESKEEKKAYKREKDKKNGVKEKTEVIVKYKKGKTNKIKEYDQKVEREEEVEFFKAMYDDTNMDSLVLESTPDPEQPYDFYNEKSILGSEEPYVSEEYGEYTVLKIDDQLDIDEVVAELAADMDVEYVQPNYKLYSYSTETRFDEQWGLDNDGQTVRGVVGKKGEDIGVEEAWELTKGSPAVLVGVLDTGIDINHNDLNANIYVNKNEIPGNGIDDDANGFVDDINGWDFFNGDGTLYDNGLEDQHGTHLAGIIAGVEDGKNITGVASNVKILPLKFMKGSFGYTSDAIAAIQYAEKMGVSIINCSFGSTENNIALKDAMASSGILFVTAAGNKSLNLDETPVYPASYPFENIVTVGSMDSNGLVSDYSNYGNAIDVVAPGSNVLSTVPGDRYDYFSGTSQSAAYVTGVAALLKSYKPDMTASDMANRIKTSTRINTAIKGKIPTQAVVDALSVLNGTAVKVIEENKIPEAPVEENESEEESTVQAFTATIDGKLMDAIHFGESGVNVATGNFSRTFTDFTVKAPGFDVKISRTYNSKDERENPIMGKGWTFGFEGNFKESEPGSGLWMVTLPDGGAHLFTKATVEGKEVYVPYDTRSSLEKQDDDSHILKTKDQYTYGFDASGKFIWMRDINGNQLTIDYTDSKPSKITDTVGREYVIAYNADNLISSVTLPNQGVIQYKYDETTKMLDEVVDPMENAKSYTYHSPSNKLKDIKDVYGNILETIVYFTSGDNIELVETHSQAIGKVSTYAYDKTARKTTITDNKERKIEKYYDADMFVTKSVDALNMKIEVEYYLFSGSNRFGEEKIITDRFGNKTEYVRNISTGNIEKIINPDGTSSSYKYDVNHNLVEEADESGCKTYYVYDENDLRLLKEVRPLNGTDVYTEFVDQSKFAITEYKYFTSYEETQYGLNAKGLVKEVIDPNGNVVSYLYDAYGNKIAVTDPMGNTTHYKYNNLGWLTETKTAEGIISLYEYDDVGNLVRTIENGEVYKRIVYDKLYRKVLEVAPNNYHLGRDGLNNATKSYSYEDDGKNVSYEYYPTGRMKKSTNALLETIEYYYDIYGNVIKKKSADGSANLYEYDAINRLISTKFAESDTSVAILLEDNSYVALENGHYRMVSKKYSSGRNYAVDSTIKNLISAEGNFETVNEIYKKNALETVLDSSEVWEGSNSLKVTVQNTAPYSGDVYLANDSMPVNLLQLNDAANSLSVSGDKYYFLTGYVKSNMDFAKLSLGMEIEGEADLTSEITDVKASGFKRLGVKVQPQDIDAATSIKVVVASEGMASDTSIYVDGLSLIEITADDYNLSEVELFKKYPYFTGEKKLNELDPVVYHIVENEYDYNDRLLTVKKESGAKSTTRYNPNGTINSDTNFNGATEHYMYDGLNRLTETWSPVEDGLYSYTKYLYDKTNNIIEEHIAKDLVGLHVRPSKDRMVIKTNTYDRNGNQINVETSGGNLIRSEYNRDNYMIGEYVYQTDDVIQKTTYKFDYAGRVTHKTKYADSKDLYGYPSAVSNEIMLTETFEYDKNGNLIKKTDSTGYSTYYTYDELDRLITTSKTVKNENDFPTKVVVTKTYDVLGYIASEIDEIGTTTTYRYDKFGNLIQERVQLKKADGSLDHEIVSSYQYDRNRNLVAKVEPKNFDPLKYDADIHDLSEMNRTELVYDKEGRLILEKEIYREASDSQTWMTLIIQALKYDHESNVVKSMTGKVYTASIGESHTAKMSNGIGTISSYNHANKLTKFIDPESQRTGLPYTVSLEYDGLLRTRTEINARGAVTHTYYDDDSNITAVTKRKSIHEPEQKLQTNEYDKAGNLVKQIDGNGFATLNEYSKMGSLIRQVLPGDDYIKENIVTFLYDKNNRIKLAEDSLGKQVLNTYDELGRILSTTQQDSLAKDIISKNVKFDISGNMRFEIDGNGNVVEYNYDNIGRLIETKATVTSIENIETIKNTQFKYDDNGNMISIVDWLGNETKKTYDPVNRLVSIKVEGAAEGTWTTIEEHLYDENSAEIKTIDANGNVREYNYDLNGRLIREIQPWDLEKKRIVERSYDSVGNIIELSDGKGNKTKYEYDHFNRLIAVVDALGIKTSYTYDINGNKISQTNGNGYTTLMEYGARNTFIRRIDHGGRKGEFGKYTYDPSKIISYTYQADGKINTMSDRNGVKTEFYYDIHRRLMDAKAGDEIKKYTYDNNNNKLSMSNNTGITYKSYDELNRVITESIPNIGTTVFVYDIAQSASGYGAHKELEAGMSAELIIDAKNHKTVKISDKQGRPYKVVAIESVDGKEQTQSVTSYEYFPNGAKKNVTYHSITQDATAVAPEFNSYTKAILATAEYTYFEDNQLKTLINKKDGSIRIDEYAYEYDEAGNRILKTVTKGTEEAENTIYTYDTLNRLKRAIEPVYIKDEAGTITTQNRTTHYTYDNAGNRLLEYVIQGSDETRVEYVYNEQNRLTSTIERDIINDATTTTKFYFDNNGNQIFETKERIAAIKPNEAATPKFGMFISGQADSVGPEFDKNTKFNDITTVNVYDEYNQLIKTTVGGTTVENIYNAEGLRVTKKSGDSISNYLYINDKIVLELDENGKEKARNLIGTNLISRTMGAETLHYMYNGHSDVIALLEASGTVQERYEYDAFGNVLDHVDNPKSPFRYGGYQYDQETKTYYLNSRMYNPRLARFLQEDTYMGNDNDPLSLNLYTYCHNEPIRYLDPSGHMREFEEPGYKPAKTKDELFDRTLRVGARGDDVKQLQIIIGAKPDGVFGPVTKRLLKRYQDANGLKSDGIAGTNTYSAMKENTTPITPEPKQPEKDTSAPPTWEPYIPAYIASISTGIDPKPDEEHPNPDIAPKDTSGGNKNLIDEPSAEKSVATNDLNKEHDNTDGTTGTKYDDANQFFDEEYSEGEHFIEYQSATDLVDDIKLKKVVDGKSNFHKSAKKRGGGYKDDAVDSWNKKVNPGKFGWGSALDSVKSGLKSKTNWVFAAAGIASETATEVSALQEEGADNAAIASAVTVNVGFGIIGNVISIGASSFASALAASVTAGLVGASAGSVVPVVGTIVGAVVGIVASLAWDYAVKRSKQKAKNSLAKGLRKLKWW